MIRLQHFGDTTEFSKAAWWKDGLLQLAGQGGGTLSGKGCGPQCLVKDLGLLVFLFSCRLIIWGLS